MRLRTPGSKAKYPTVVESAVFESDNSDPARRSLSWKGLQEFCGPGPVENFALLGCCPRGDYFGTRGLKSDNSQVFLVLNRAPTCKSRRENFLWDKPSLCRPVRTALPNRIRTSGGLTVHHIWKPRRLEIVTPRRNLSHPSGFRAALCDVARQWTRSSQPVMKAWKGVVL
jgi:hypothetical protein